MKKKQIKQKKHETKIKIRGYSKKNNKATARKAAKSMPAKHLLL